MQFARSSFVVAGLITALAAGCGDGRPKRVPVAGQVLIDGKPLTFGSVQFVPPTGRPSQGELDSQGRFRLSCYEKNDGAVLGTHQIAIISAKELSPFEVRWFTPKKFADFKTSGVTREITGPEDNLEIKISWEGGKEFVESIQGTGNEGMQGKRGQKQLPTP
jgi:hypothetical protein